jgi:DNA repair protein RadC
MEISTLKRKKISREANYPRRYPSKLKLVKTIGTLSEQGISEVQIMYSINPLQTNPIIIANSAKAVEAFRTFFEGIEHRESCYLLLLNRSSEIIGFYLVCIGGISSSIIDQRIIFQAALLSNSTSIIIAHNHPSGNLIPSNADCEITEKIKNAGKFLDIPLLDHIIITRDSYFSFTDSGKL